MSTKEERRDLVAEMYPLKTQQEIADELEVHRNTVSADIKAIRRENFIVRKTDAAIDWNAQMEDCLARLQDYKAVADQMQPAAKVRLGLAIMDRWLKLIDINSPKMLLVGGVKNPEDMSRGELLDKLMNDLSEEQCGRVFDLIASFHHVELEALPTPYSTVIDWEAVRAGDPQEPLARTLLEGTVISPSGEAMRPGHGDGK